PVIFLGEWCRLHDRKDIWSKLDARVVPYHWNDRQKLFRDYEYLMNLHERILSEMAKNLNSIHNQKHSIRYWRILLGPWLGWILPIFFDRWSMIQKVVNEYDISHCRIIDDDYYNYTSSNMLEFSKNATTDRWNQFIYSFIIEKWTNIDCEKFLCVSPSIKSNSHSPSFISMKNKIMNNLIDYYNILSTLGLKQDDAFISSELMPFTKLLQFQLKLGQLPQYWKHVHPIQSCIDTSLRQWKIQIPFSNNFERALCSLIPLQLPTLYLEGYNKLLKQISALPRPLKPKFICCGTSQIGDDVFKAWSAKMVDCGVPLYIIQHGGHYGSGLFSFHEEHEILISDMYCSWGWSLNSSNKVIPTVATKLLGGRKKAKWNPKGNALLVTAATPRYSYWLYSAMIAGQWLDYFDDICTFFDSLPASIQSDVLVRQKKSDYEWNQIARWKERYRNISVDTGDCPIEKLTQNCRLFISTYNATTFLETLAKNIPTIIFWNTEHWELRSSALPYFKQLEKVGIFHQNPYLAAVKVSEIWDDVTSWWYNAEVQEARKVFCNQYARIPDNPIRELTQLLDNK
ncbi:LIC12162 family protein, partial [Methanocalculus sp.]|uniref:LIC12162 family transferase n=1 Tax=Methanocalculus sp. TaxID=2004547 RepID=UPI0026306B4B